MQKIREAVRPDYKQFVLRCKPDGDLGDFTTVSFDTLRSTLLSYLSKDCLLNHEIVTVCRFFSAEQAMPPSCDRNRVRAAAQLELKRALWNGVEQLNDHLGHINPTCRPYISEAQVRSTSEFWARRTQHFFETRQAAKGVFGTPFAWPTDGYDAAQCAGQ